MGKFYILFMRIIARKTLRDFWEQHKDAENPLKAWYEITRAADWKTAAEVTATFSKVDYVGDNRVVFNIGGNKYRLIVKFNFPYRVAYIRFIGTHKEYDKTDVKTA